MKNAKKKPPKKKTRTYWRKKGCEEAKHQHRIKHPYCEICEKSFCKIDI